MIVLSGSLHLGYGDLLEVAAAERFGAGSVLVVPAGERHFDGGAGLA